MDEDGLFLLVTTDTLRYDAVNREDCPRIADLGEGGVSFANAYSTGSGTSSAFPGIMASALPLDRGYRGLDHEHVSVAEHLQRRGVTTVGVTASSHASSLFGYDRGFDVFREDPAYREESTEGGSLLGASVARLKRLAKMNPVTERIGAKLLHKLRKHGAASYPYERAEVVTDRAIDALRAGGVENCVAPVFAWIHYMEPHSPYYPPDEILDKVHDGDEGPADVHRLLMRWYDERKPLWTGEGGDHSFDDEEIAVLRSFYRAQIRYLDREVGRLLDWLDEQGIRDRTTVALTSDHGEEFFDHGDFGHRQKLYEELIHVPFVVDDGEHAGRRDGLVSHTDIAPTACNLLGIEPADVWHGRSLTPLLESDGDWDRDHVLSELCHRGVEEGYGGDVKPEQAVIAVVTDDWKFILNRQRDSEELFALEEAGIDAVDVIDDRPKIAEELRAIAEERLEAITETTIEKEDLSDEVRDRLHQLGYTGE